MTKTTAGNYGSEHRCGSRWSGTSTPSSTWVVSPDFLRPSFSDGASVSPVHARASAATVALAHSGRAANPRNFLFSRQNR